MKRDAFLTLVLWLLLGLPAAAPAGFWGDAPPDPQEAWGALSAPQEASGG